MTSLRLLRSFLAVMDCGSVVAAARERGYSAAAVSRQIGELQQRMGVRLFEPSGRSIRPTPHAWELASHARPLIDEADRFERFVKRADQQAAPRPPRANFGRAGLALAATRHPPG